MGSTVSYFYIGINAESIFEVHFLARISHGIAKSEAFHLMMAFLVRGQVLNVLYLTSNICILQWKKLHGVFHGKKMNIIFSSDVIMNGIGCSFLAGRAAP